MKKVKLLLVCALTALIGGTGLASAHFAVAADPAGDQAEVDGNAYATLAEAQEHWTDGTTLKLLSDVTVSDTIVLSTAGERTLDLNGKTLSAERNDSKHSRLLSLSAGTLTIKDETGNGVLSGDTVESDGGVISVTNGATLNLKGGIVKDGFANGGRGGGIYAHSSTLNLSGGEVQKNTANLGGGIYAEDSTILMTGTTVSGNKAIVNGGGVAVWGEAQQSVLTLSGGSISNNETEGNGGGVLLWKNTQFTLSGGATISDNKADAGGGGVYARGALPGQDSEEAAMAADAAVVCTIDMKGGTVEKNTVGNGFGGGLKISAGAVFNMNGGTVTNNYALIGGGGISVEYNASANFGGQSVVWENHSGEEGLETANNIYLVQGSHSALDDDLEASALLGFNMVSYGVISENFGGSQSVIESAVKADSENCKVMLQGKSVILGSSLQNETGSSGGTTGTPGTTGSSGNSNGSSFGFIAVITLSAIFVIALIVVGILTDGFKGKKKKSE